MNAQLTLDSTYVRAALLSEIGTTAKVGQKLKEFVDRTMQTAKATMGNYYTSGEYVTGELRDSGFVDEPTYSGDLVTVEAGFGRDGPASQYALHVHEGHHLIVYGHDSGIDIPPAKYWETPFMEAMGQFDREVGEPIGMEIEASWGGR